MTDINKSVDLARERADVVARLRDSLLFGADTSDIRREIAAIDRKIADAGAAQELAAAETARDRAASIKRDAEQIYADIEAELSASLAALQPPPYPQKGI